jgi:FOG: LysM repeat
MATYQYEERAALSHHRSQTASNASEQRGTPVQELANLQEGSAATSPLSSNLDLTPPADLWVRVRQGLRLPDRDHPRVERARRWCAHNQAYMDRVVDRATPYLYFILEEVERRGMPAEIALLPIVESAFQPFAYSPRRAAGIWQFIPATGRLYGLPQNWWYDGRRDIYAATHAALDYLEKLNADFEGDWLLAVAAYNAGEGTVMRAVERNRKAGKPTDFWHLRLPQETQSYVPKLLAIASLVAEPHKYGITLKPILAEPYFAVIDVGSQIDLALAAELAELSLEEIYQLNPGFNRWATCPHGPHRLLLPVKREEGFLEKLAAIPKEHHIQWKRHRIARGETLNHIARRYQTTVALLRQANHLQSTSLLVGEYILVPIAARSMDHYASHVNQKAAAFQEGTRSDRNIIYTVQPKDTLWNIAQKYRVSVHTLSAWNAIAPSEPLYPGQKLALRVGGGVQGADAKPRSIPVTLSDNVQQGIRYVVKHGDSLYSIARRFNISVMDLCRWNALREGQSLKPGQRLTLYVDVIRKTKNI